MAAGRRTPKRRWRWLVVTCCVAGGLFLTRGLWLRWAALLLLISEDPVRQTTYLTLLSGDRRFEAASALYREGVVREILLVEKKPTRLELLGVRPSEVETGRRELSARGVPAAAIRVIPGAVDTDWEAARALRAWLQEHPGTELLVLANRFGTRRLRHIVGRELPGDAAARVLLRGLPHRDYDEANWWRRKEGVLDFFHCSLSAAYSRLNGEGGRPRATQDADDYERAVP